MARRRVLLAAQNRHSALAHLGLQPLDPFQEHGRLGEFVVENAAVVVIEIGVGGLAAEFLAQEDIRDPCFVQRGTKLLAVKMLNIPGIGARTHVGHNLDPMLVQQLNKHLKGVV